MSETEDYYAYSSDEEGVMDDEEDEYEVDDEGDENSQVMADGGGATDMSQGSTNNKAMEWDVSSNPNAAPTSHHHHPAVVAAQMAHAKTGIRILDSKDLKPEMCARVKELTEVLGVSAAAAATLLREFHYSKERVLEQYMVDADAVLKKCGVYHRVAAPQPPNKTEACPICYDDMDSADKTTSLSMPCGHVFCLDCWCDFCTNAIAEGPSCVTCTCPQAGCTERVTEEEFATALGAAGDDDVVLQISSSRSEDKTGNNNNNNTSNKDDNNSLLPTSKMAKYTEFQLRNFVESNPLTRWCPGRGCERVACAESTAAMESENNLAHCSKCLTDFCMVCGLEPHAPVSCKDLLKWTEKCRNESETANWILANTKSCPKCVSRIEKNQGCNHMTCQRCKFEFCWICMGDWKDHGANTGGYYKCSRYRENEDPSTDSARAKRDLDRYLHYYRRFHAHQEAEKFARKHLKETEERMVALQEASDDAKWTDVEFLKTANMQLVECRRVLKYTYVFSYYLPMQQTAARERFEHHQEMLERFTEHLSELSEMPLADMDRTDVVNKTRVVDRFMKNILKYVEDGMEED